MGFGRDVSGEAVGGRSHRPCRTCSSPAPPARARVCASTPLVACLALPQYRRIDLKMLHDRPQAGRADRVYNGIPHLLAPVVVEVDRVIVACCSWVAREMDRRYQGLSPGCRGPQHRRALTEMSAAPRGETRMPMIIVVFIDELADLMMAAPGRGGALYLPSSPRWPAPRAFTWSSPPSVPRWM